jgi:hypothetical protein
MALQIRYRDWNIRFRPCKNGVSGYIAWASKSELCEEDALLEGLEKDVWFEFGDTSDEVITKLQSELNDVDLEEKGGS